MNFRRILTILAILIASVAVDQATKAVAKHYLTDREPISMLGDGVRLQLAHNYGTFLGLGASLPPNVRNAATTIGVGIVLTALLAYAILSKPENRFATTAFALLIGGGLSNLLDRIMYGGYVVDFLNMGLGPVRTGIFNVADMFIMAGVFILLFSEQLQRKFSRGTSEEGIKGA